MPDLYRTLEKYAECYRQTYGEAQKVGDLIPFMLEAFLASDKDFAKTRRDMDLKTTGEEG